MGHAFFCAKRDSFCRPQPEFSSDNQVATPDANGLLPKCYQVWVAESMVTARVARSQLNLALSVS